MRTLAIIANLLLLAAIGFMVATGELQVDTEYIPLFLLMLTAPTLSIIALLLRGVGSKDWLSRYFERTAMEERRKLEMFRLQNGQPGAALNGGPATLVGNWGVPKGPPLVG